MSDDDIEYIMTTDLATLAEADMGLAPPDLPADRGGDVSGSHIFVEHLAKSLADTQYRFQLLRRERRAEPRYAHLWQGWGWRLRHFLEFDDWDQLLNPTRPVVVHNPCGVIRLATGECKGREVDFGFVDFGEQAVGGTFERVQMSDRDGRVIAEIELTVPRHVNAGEFIALTDLRIIFS